MMSDSGYTVNEVTDASLRQSFIYAQLAVRGLDTNMIGTPLTVELSKAFDAYFAVHDAEVAAKALSDAADELTPGDDKVDDWGIEAGLLRARAAALGTPEQEEER